MTRLILHVGMDKTGTTAIQHALNQTRAALLSGSRVLVPLTGRWSDHSHHPFAFAAFESMGFTHADLAALFAALQAEIAASGAQTVLLTSECLFKVPFDDPRSPFFDHVARLFDDVRVIVYVRRQDRWVESRHRHSIISGNELTLDQLIRPNFCDYKRFIDLWADHFGTDAIILRPYERGQFAGRDIAEDFLAALGIPVPAGDFEPASEKNSAFHYKDVLFRAAVNPLKLPPDLGNVLNEFLLERVHDGDPNRHFLSSARARDLVQRYAPVNAALARTYMGRGDDMIFLDPEASYPDEKIPSVLCAAECRVVLDALTQAQPSVAKAIRKRLAVVKIAADDRPVVRKRLQALAEAANVRLQGDLLPKSQPAAPVPVPAAPVPVPAASAPTVLAAPVSASLAPATPDAPVPDPSARPGMSVIPLARNLLHDLQTRMPRRFPSAAPTGGKPRLFLHVGMGKTGTTSIQQFCWANRALLKKSGVTYPGLGVKAGAHHRLSPHVPPFLAKTWTFIDPDDWAPRLAASAHQPILLSSELMASGERSVVLRAASILQRHFDVRIIMYVRRIDDSIMASYNQTVKAGTQRQPIEAALPGMFEKLRIDRVLAIWTEAFGAANLIIRPYDRGQWPGGDILRDFCAVVGVVWSPDFRAPAHNPNARLGRAALEFKRCLNVVIPDTKVSLKFNRGLLDHSSAQDQTSSAIYYEADLLPGAVRRKLIVRQEGFYRDLAEGLSGLQGAPLFSTALPEDDLTWSPLALTQAAFEEIGRAVLTYRLRFILRRQIAEARASDNPQRLLYAARFQALV